MQKKDMLRVRRIKQAVNVYYWSCGRPGCMKKHTTKGTAQRCQNKFDPNKTPLSIRQQHLQTVIRTVSTAIEVSSGVKIITIAQRRGVSGTTISQENQKGLKYGATHGSLQAALDVARAALAEIKEPINKEKVKPAKTPAFSDVFLRNIKTLELSCRATNCLFNAGINNIGELMSVRAVDLLKRKNFGIKSLIEINQALSEIGLRID